MLACEAGQFTDQRGGFARRDKPGSNAQGA